MGRKQMTEFLNGEGDSWFERNLNEKDFSLELQTHEDFLIRCIPDEWKSKQSDRTMAEIGCSRGDSLARISRECGISAIGIDPSQRAIAEGREMFPDLDLRVGVGEDLRLSDKSIDLCYFGFSMMYMDAAGFLKAYSEARRVLTADGLIAIADFDYLEQGELQLVYKHKKGLFTFRRNYTRILLSEGFELVGKAPFTPGSNNLFFSGDSLERHTIVVASRPMQPW